MPLSRLSDEVSIKNDEEVESVTTKVSCRDPLYSLVFFQRFVVILLSGFFPT